MTELDDRAPRRRSRGRSRVRAGRAASGRSRTPSPTVYVTLAALIAIIPLVWVLYTVISKGCTLVLDLDLVAAEPARHHPAPRGRRRLPRDRRHR